LRPYHRQQILDLLQTIMDAQDKGQYAVCQEGAEAVIDFIASFGDDVGTQTIKLLEQYFELLFKVNINEIKSRVLYKHLSKILTAVNTEIKPTRLEVAFISHKAAMSDSIESIYLAAKQDPDCDAFFVPVPYYEHNKEGKPETLKYEGPEHYNANIECINWEMYDIEARRPDVIFTFNAYDEQNKVSSIHPNYYNSRLRGLTECLCFLPYLIPLALNEGANKFAVLPGCIYSHIAVVGNERIRNCFTNTYKPLFKEVYGKAEDKFIVLGSPKVDKVVNVKRGDFTVPQEWEKILKNKKVFLLISSIGAALGDGVNYLMKLAQILNLFKSRSDVALWWRPHPLLESTYHSMLPNLLHTYTNIVNQYIKEGWGIYDNDSDLHRSIAMSDAYYGDWSSILTMYQATEKPILLANTFLHPEMRSWELGCRKENDENKLVDYINSVVNENYVAPENGLISDFVNKNGTAGKEIYTYAKQLSFGNISK